MSFLLSCGATACLVTAFDLAGPSTGSIFWFSLLLSGAFSLSMAYRSRWWTPAALAIGFLFLLSVLAGSQGVSLVSSVESLLYQVSLTFNRTYRWGVIHWSDTAPTEELLPALLLVIGLLALTVSATVCRRLRATGAVLLCLTPLLLCMVARDTVPDGWGVFLLFVGLGLLVLTGSSRRMDAAAGRRLTAMVLIPTLLATAVLFWIFPPSGYGANGISYGIVSWVQSLPFWSSVASGGSGSTGDAALETVDLTALGDRRNDTALAMTVVASHSGQLYLRGRGYDSYDGRSWTSTTDSSGRDLGWSSPGKEDLRSVTIVTKTLRPLLYFPGSTGVDLQGKAFSKGYLPNHQDLLEYTFSYGTPDEDAAPGSITATDWLELPTETRAGAVELLASVLKGVDPATPAAVALAIENYVEACAEYSRSPSSMPGDAGDFAMWFLNEAEAGYCVHFATAATVLLRAAGIPARYVTGYSVKVTAGRKTNVLERYAHAWTEYFLPDVGWTILDATPGSPGPDPLPAETPETTAPPETQPPTEATDNTEASQGATSPTESTGSTQAATQRPTEQVQQAPSFTVADQVTAVIRWLLVAAGALVALWAQYRLRIRARHRYLHRGSANRQALRRYRLIILRSRLLKKAIPPHLTELAEKARFSQHTLTGAELLVLDQYLEVLAGELTKNSRLLRFLFAIE